MNENLQPVPHLSPDQLSAFAENVLPEHERLAALMHLSNCADCRQVVFLAQQADPAVTFSALGPETPRRVWFSLPQIFGAATAALACSLILALIVHHNHDQSLSTQSVATAKLEQQPAVTPTSPTSTPNPSPPALQPANPAHISATATHASLTSPAASVPKPMPQPLLAPPRSLGAMGTGMPSGYTAEGTQQDKTSYGANSAPSANTYAALPPKAPAGVTGAMPAPAPPPPPPMLPPSQESRMRQAATAKSKKDFSAAETVTVTAAAPSMDATTEVAADSISTTSVQQLPLSGRAVQNYAALTPGIVSTSKLPSKKPAAALLSSGTRTLALDTAGNLFLSFDRGTHWTVVTPQWPGKVVAISLARAPARLYLQQPTQNQSQTQSGNSINGNATNGSLPQQQAPTPTAGFDLTTATGAVWHSNDGLTWHAR